jgi:hypothetical protein
MTQPKALFLRPDGVVLPDNLVCSGLLVADLGGRPCPYAVDGRIPDPEPLDAQAPTYSVDKGAPGDLCPPCVKQKLGSLAHWQGHRGQQFPEHLLSLRLFKCRMWLWLVVAGLREDTPAVLASDGEVETEQP